LAYQQNDHYAKKARKENYAARSVYKLQEINDKYKIIRKGNLVLDLGCSPGSWSQYTSETIGLQGKLLGIDLKKVFLTLPNAVFMKGDILTLEMGPVLEEKGFTKPFDVVISDMAPDTTTNRFTDQMRSLELCEMALATAIKFLKPGGNFVCKIFESNEGNEFRKSLKDYFEEVHIMRPKSVQKSSKEIFLIGKGFKAEVAASEM
jgi:23S rRNA (uridine2552-2'-O)-methyltransferase